MTSKNVGDHVELQRGTTYKSKLLDLPGPILLGLGSIERDGGFRTNKLRTYGGPSPDKLLLYPCDIYVSLKDVTQSGDLLGSVARVPKQIEVGRMTQDTVKLLFKTDIDRSYLYWLLRTPEYRQHCRSHATGTTNLGLSRDDFFSFEVPEINHIRKTITETLDCIENKIELNTQTNQTLEQIARVIFKSWFVDFEPVKAKMGLLEAGGTAEQAELAAMSAISAAGHGNPNAASAGRAGAAKDEAALKQLQAEQPDAYAELAQTAVLFPSAMEESEHGEIPNGWKYAPVINSAEYINGAAYKNMHFSNAPDAKPVIKIAELKNGITDNTKFTNTELGDKFKLNTRDILFSWSGSPETSIDTFIWTGGEAWLNQHIFKVVNDNEEERCFTYWLLKFLKPTFIGIAKNKQTTGLGHVTRKDMERLHYCKPNDDAMSLFYKSAGSLLNKIENNLIENFTLAESRDELLPKLLAGDLPIINTEVA